jgi:hypothetical protein
MSRWADHHQAHRSRRRQRDIQIRCRAMSGVSAAGAVLYRKGWSHDHSWSALRSTASGACSSEDRRVQTVLQTPRRCRGRLVRAGAGTRNTRVLVSWESQEQLARFVCGGCSQPAACRTLVSGDTTASTTQGIGVSGIKKPSDGSRVTSKRRKQRRCSSPVEKLRCGKSS